MTLTESQLVEKRADLPFRPALYQTGPDRFTVVYGFQRWENLYCGEAARQYGECIFHALACDGKIENLSEVA